MLMKRAERIAIGLQLRKFNISEFFKVEFFEYFGSVLIDLLCLQSSKYA